MRNLSNDNSHFASPARRIIFKLTILLISLIFIGRLAHLQIMQGSDYQSVSEAQAIKKVRTEPYRGHVYDRFGNLIVHNEPSFTVTLTQKDFNIKSLPLLESILGIDSTEIYKKLNEFDYYTDFTPVSILRDATLEQVAQIEEFADYLKGVEVKTESKRLYESSASMTHILGYVREISGEQIKKMPYRKPGDLIGQTGLEKTYDNFIRGKEGTKFVAVNNFGQYVASFNDGNQDVPPNNGFDLYLTLDLKLQTLAEELLKDKKGAIVVMDPNNGEILALASKPDYDLTKFSGGVDAKTYAEVTSDKDFPLIHRAIQSQYPPGSTWKMLIAIAALEENIINKNSIISSPGVFVYGNRSFGDHAPAGAYNVRRAVQTSCNVFFYKMGLRIGYDVFEKYGKMFGFGQKTGIDLPNEKSGILPTRDWLLKRYGKGGDTKGRLVNYGIGQGEILVTPLQMAQYISAIANRGTIHQPHIVNSFYNKLTNSIEPIDYKSLRLPVSRGTFEAVIEGMSDAVNAPGGTSGRARVDGINVCGKTGTAQNPHGKDHAWFVSFAPKENPEIVVVAFVENAGYGGVVSAPMSQKIMQQFFYPDSLYQESVIDSTLQASEINEFSQ
jgi:penicillin-binding protein 2